MPSDIAEAFYGAGYTVLEGYQYESSSVLENVITVVHSKSEKRINFFTGKINSIKIMDECKIQVSIDRHWTFADYYNEGIDM